MLVSWNWLKQYVTLDMPLAELENRLMMSGLNHEASRKVGDDTVIDLEVTSNRPDCLGHIGVAREIAVLWRRTLNVPDPRPAGDSASVADLARVRIDCPDLCSRYTARVVRGVQVGPSPEWLERHLNAVGVGSINNVVDVTNYVLMECGQPLHAFDLEKLAGRQIDVRTARPGETFSGIDHRQYHLEPKMCVIADAHRAVALAGVMGGADTEVSPQTADLLIESACFDPVSVRTTARALSMHTASSYRFERGVDPEAIDWASRRCCEMILDLAGGTLASGCVDVGPPVPAASPITLRLAQVARILGITIAPQAIREILAALGLKETHADASCVQVVPPSWRRDLTREIDLVEEVARIHGYEEIPEDARVPMTASHRRSKDRALDRIRHVVTAAGFHEAMTASAVDEQLASIAGPWSSAEAVRCTPPVLRGSDRLRQSLVPSLLAARRSNETLANDPIELFEIAHVYWPQQKDTVREEEMLALCSGREFFAAKGVVESLTETLSPGWRLDTAPIQHGLLESQHATGLAHRGTLVGYIGQLSAAGLERMNLRRPATVVELRLALLLEAAVEVKRFAPLSPYPAVVRDRNFLFEEQVRWADVERVVRDAAGTLLENIVFQETYRDEERIGRGTKSLLFRVTLRSHTETLTREQADAACARVDEQLQSQLGGQLR